MLQRPREHKGWTQEHLARASGLSLRTIQRIEAGDSASKDTILSLAAALDVAQEQIKGSDSLRRFQIIALTLGVALVAVLVAGWFLYTQDFSVQTQYWFNYRAFLAVSSLITGIYWGAGCAWWIHIQGKLIGGLAI